jgi:Domain of unknown function (DUF4136)
MKNFFLLAAIVLIAAPVAAQAQNVKVDYDRSVEFTKYKTYSWVNGRPASNPQVHKFIVDEIDRQLQSKGMKRVEAEADLNITYYASLDENINTSAVEYVKNADWKKWGEHDVVYGTKMVAQPIVMMVLDIADASTNKLVWRGRAKDAYTPNQARGKKRMNKAVEKLLAKYPMPSPK